MRVSAPVTARDRIEVPATSRRGGERNRLPRTAHVVGLAALFALFALSALIPASARAEPARAPVELLVEVAIGPAATLQNLAAYADAAKPGAGAGVSSAVVRDGLAGAIGARSLDGLDPASWSYLLIASVDGASALALVSKVADAKKLAASAGAARVSSKGGWAIVGQEAVVDRIAPYALATLPARRAPGALTATVYLPHVLARYRSEIEAARRQLLATMAGPTTAQMAPIMMGYIDGILSLAADTDRLVATLETTADLASLDLALVPRPGSRLAKFVAVQRPSNYALLERLPDAPAQVLVGGHLEAGPYHDQVLELMATFYGPSVSKELLAPMTALTRVMTGDIAVTARFAPGAGMTFTQIFGVSDTGAADRAIAALFALYKDGRTFEMMGISTTVKADAGTAAHDGVALRSYETSYDVSKASDADRKVMEAMMARTTRMHVGVFDRLGLIALAPNSRSDAERTIDAARGKAPHFTAPQRVGQLLASSRARKDSVVVMMDLGSIMATIAAVAGGQGQAPAGVEPIVVSLGCADRNAHIRIGVPATTLRTAVNRGKP